MLPQAEQQVGAGQHQAGTGQARFAAPEAENQRDDQHQGKYRVDDPDDTPCDTAIAEGPQQLDAIAGAGVEQAAGGVTEQREAIDFFENEAFAQQRPEYRRGDQRPDRDEYQRVRKVPVKLDVEQRIFSGTDQDVGIGQQSGSKTDNRRGPSIFFIRDRQRQHAAEQTLG